MNRIRMSDVTSFWEDLRKQACQLENEVDLKLVSFSKLGTNYSMRDYGSHLNDPLSVSNKASTAQLFQNMSLDIEQLLAKLTQINEKMSECLRMPAGGAGATVLHTLQRHWDILQDYSHEFRKIQANVRAVRDREELLEAVQRDSSHKASNTTDLYLKEHDHLLRKGFWLIKLFAVFGAVMVVVMWLELKCSDRLIEEQISIAMATRENMQNQKGMLYGVTDKLTALANRFPVVNSLMQKINLRKRRDAVIVSLVIALCLILLLWYAVAH